MAEVKVIRKPKPGADSKAKKEAPRKEEPKKVEAKSTIYHVSKRDNNGREWKVFIEGSDKVIKLFKTQQEALDYAISLAKNKNDGSSVRLHGLDGKMRKY